jgi:hypothetical protein
MTLMRRCVFSSGLVMLMACGSVAAAGEERGWITNYNRLLAKYVTPAGVRYAEWKADAGDMQAIEGIVNGIANEQVGSLERDAQLAFYINAYNAWILHEALEKYPTKSVKDTLFTFFTSKRIKVAGEQMSFNHLEKDLIRPKFGEPRVHFALNCASRSCPPLQAEAYDGGKLDAQLEKLAKAFVNSDLGVVFDAASKTARLSKIFDWYKDDFTNRGGAVAFINKRRTSPLPTDAKITYQDYDWGLNEAK